MKHFGGSKGAYDPSTESFSVFMTPQSEWITHMSIDFREARLFTKIF